MALTTLTDIPGRLSQTALSLSRSCSTFDELALKDYRKGSKECCCARGEPNQSARVAGQRYAVDVGVGGGWCGRSGGRYEEVYILKDGVREN